MEKLIETLYVIDDTCDPRQKMKVMFPLSEIVLMLIVGTLARCDTIREIYTFAEYNLKELKKILPFENGLPAEKSFYWIAKQMEGEYVAFLIEMLQLKGIVSGADDVIAIDGKTACGSRRRGKKAIHIVSAQSATNHITLAHVPIKEKHHEIEAFTSILKAIDCTGKIITSDAAGTYPRFVNEVLKRGGNYMVPLKQNQKTMFKTVAEWFQQKADYQDELDIYRHSEGQGLYMETRYYAISHDISILESVRCKNWPSIAYVGEAVHERYDFKKGCWVRDVRYFIGSSKYLRAKTFGEIVRQHWSVETMHQYLDVSFHEDDCRVSDNDFVVSLNIIRKFVLSKYRQYRERTGDKRSINMLRMHASFDLATWIAEVLQ